HDGVLEELKEKEILKVLLAEHPVVVTIPDYDSFMNYTEKEKDDVYPCFITFDVTGKLIDHVIVLVGFRKTGDGIHYFLAMNSLGKTWGRGGYGKIA
ncbi:hypothetical protein LINPERPRIM_LOCUS18969, partial [Linum perenne]